MSPFPVKFTDRWNSPSRLSYDDAVCWHVLLGSDAAARAAAATARQRLARFTGLHTTPPEWLHVTILRAGTAGTVTRDDMSRMLATAQDALAQTAPVTVTLERVLYHPEAIVLSVAPGSVLRPVFEAARTATREVLGPDAGDVEGDEFTPHMTLAYSAAEQPAAPVIAELGKTLPPCRVTIREVSLVVQHGPEDQWNWQVAGSARLLGGLGPPGVLPVRCPCRTRSTMPRLPGKRQGILVPGDPPPARATRLGNAETVSRLAAPDVDWVRTCGSACNRPRAHTAPGCVPRPRQV
jgi:2'-5' RNA ligase